jgi:hypothetical protein
LRARREGIDGLLHVTLAGRHYWIGDVNFEAYMANTMMVFGGAKKVVEDMVKAIE